MRALKTLIILLQVLAVGLSCLASASGSELISLVRNGDMHGLRNALDAGAEVNDAEPDGSTALHWAAHDDQHALVEVLISVGADVSRKNRYGVTPSFLAVENGSSTILTLLLDAGADPDETMPGNETLLMAAARNGDPESVRTLLAAGADPNRKEATRGQTALMWAAANNNWRAIELLVAGGADIHARTENPSRAGTRPFAYPPPTGFTPLLFAVREGHVEATRSLLNTGADVNDQVADGQSALVIAAANANWEIAGLLVDRGADVTAADAGWNALHQTVRTRRMNLAFGTPGPFASGTVDSSRLMRKLLDAGIDVNARMTRNGLRDGQRNRLNRLGATAFLLAAKVTDVEAMQLLLEYGADPTIPTADGTTPLMVAAGLHIWNPGEDGGSFTGQESEVLEAVKLTVAGGNDVNARNYRGETALHGIGFRGVNSVLDYLVEQGADLTAETDDGWTPLAFARGFSYTDFYKSQLHTATRMEALMRARGLDTEGEQHYVPGEVCYDCLQTRGDQIQAMAIRDRWMEENFDPENFGIQMLPFWDWLPFPDPARNTSVDVSTPRERR